MAERPRHERRVHQSLDPARIVVRESRDSVEHPNSTAVMVIFDVTGSMKKVPEEMQQRLPDLMQALLQHGYLPDPQILIGAVGDHECDQAPLQIGQFESGNEIEGDLGNLFLEGGGGGNNGESYLLAFWAAAHLTSMDCLEQRSRKGYLFVIGDEPPLRSISREQLQKVCGTDREYPQSVSIEDAIAAAKEKFHTFFITPGGTSWWSDNRTSSAWEALLGRNYLRMERPADICGVVAAAIGLTEGTTTHDEIAQAFGDGETGRRIADIVANVAATATEPGGAAAGAGDYV